MQALFWGKGKISCRVHNSDKIIVRWGRLTSPPIKIQGADIEAEYDGYFVLSGLSPIGSVSIAEATFSWEDQGSKTVFTDTLGRKLWSNLEGVIEEELFTEQERDLSRSKTEKVEGKKKRAAFFELAMAALLCFLLARVVKGIFF